MIDAAFAGTDDTEDMPDIIEFVMSPKYLNRPNIYPRQGTLLKVIFLEHDLLTDYDYDVLAQWSKDFTLPAFTDKDVLRFEGDHGIQPDWETRMQICTEEGRPWFREIIAAIGRRGSKGFLGGLIGARVLWHYLSRGDVHGYYGIDRDKPLSALVFAGKREQARVNQWRDLVNVILGAPCFGPYISQSLTTRLSIYSRWDAHRWQDMIARGVVTEMDYATFELLPKESTATSGRGPATFFMAMDEMAHMINSGPNRSADEVYESATPSLDQFHEDACIYEASSTWAQTGKFYENWQASLSLDPETRLPLRPEMLMVQLTSWDLYEDWQHAKSLATGSSAIPTYLPLKGAIQSYDEQMKRLERSNPEAFRVERLSKWASTVDAYLSVDSIEAMFGPWRGETLAMQSTGILARTYVMHGDPSKSGDGFGLAIAHSEGPDDNGHTHVVFDLLHAWEPHNFEAGIIDYIQVQDELQAYLRAFMPSTVTFDQFGSVGLIQRLNAYVAKSGLPKRIAVSEFTATRKRNWQMAETFKTALGLGLIHAPWHELADLELRFLRKTAPDRVDHQSTGPVTTNDVATAMFNCAYHIIGDQMALFADRMSALPVGMSAQGGISIQPPKSTRPSANFPSRSSAGSTSAARRVVAKPPRRRSR